MKSSLKYLGYIALFILADIVTKGVLLYMITGGVPVYGAAWSVVPVPYMMARVCNVFNIVFTWNPGASFSMFRAIGEAAPIIMILITGAVIACILWYMFRRADNYERMPLALITGGAIGNLIDRVRFGAVVDFLDFHIGGWHYPAFNIADTCIVIGVGLYLLNWIIARRRCVNKTKE